MMLTGTMANREILSDKLRAHPSIKDADITRAESINKLYGPGNPNQAPTNDAERNALRGKETLVIEQRDDMRVMTFLRPMIASKD